MLKILVPIKKVVDYNVQVRPTSDNKSVDTENVKMGINPFDEIALEEAVRLKEKKSGNNSYFNYHWKTYGSRRT